MPTIVVVKFGTAPLGTYRVGLPPLLPCPGPKFTTPTGDPNHLAALFAVEVASSPLVEAVSVSANIVTIELSSAALCDYEWALCSTSSAVLDDYVIEVTGCVPSTWDPESSSLVCQPCTVAYHCGVRRCAVSLSLPLGPPPSSWIVGTPIAVAIQGPLGVVIRGAVPVGGEVQIPVADLWDTGFFNMHHEYIAWAYTSSGEIWPLSPPEKHKFTIYNQL